MSKVMVFSNDDVKIDEESLLEPHIVLHLRVTKEEIDNYAMSRIGSNSISSSMGVPCPYESSLMGFSSLLMDTNLSENESWIPQKTMELKTDNNEMVDANHFLSENARYTSLNLKVPHVPMENLHNLPSSQPNENERASDVQCRLIDSMCEFADANRRNEWPVSTSIYCQWCCHPFQGPPVALPRWYIRGVFYVDGNYCSYGCAAADLFRRSEHDDHEKWDRFSLLHLLRKCILNLPESQPIKLAPQREVLKIFGGYLSIQNFRDITASTHSDYKVFKIIQPPIVAVVPKIEEQSFPKPIEENMVSRTLDEMQYVAPRNENYLSRSRWGKTKPYIPIDQDRIKQAENNLRIRRSKPLLDKEKTLFHYMDLKIRQAKQV